MTLQELIEKLESFVDELIEGDADLTTEMLGKLTELSEAKAEKIDSYGYVHERLCAEIIGAEARLQYITERYERRVRQLSVAKLRLEQRLVGMYQEGLLKSKEEGKNYKLTFRNYPTVRVNVKPEELPVKFRDEKVVVKPKLNELKKALKDNPDDIMFMAELEDNYKAQFK
jgi:hypothetical protein